MADATLIPDPATMDLSVAPGEDFFRHVNGGWLDANPIPPDRTRWSEADQLRDRVAARLLALTQQDGPDAPAWRRRLAEYVAVACDEAAAEAAGLTPIAELLAVAAGVRAHADLPAAAAALHRAGVKVLHGWEVEGDVEDPSRNLLYVLQGGLGLPEPGFYTRQDDVSREVLEAYERHVAAQLGHAGQPAGDPDPAAAARAVVGLETRIAEVSWPPEALRDPTRTVNRFAVDGPDGLDGLMPRFGLGRHVRALGVTSPAVNVNVPDQLRALDGIVAETAPEALRAYLRWHVVNRFARTLSAAVADEAFAFWDRRLHGQDRPQDRWQRALDAAAWDLPVEIGRRFVEDSFPPTARDRCRRMVEGLRGAMRRSIEGAPWMSDATRAHALRKLASMSVQVGFPDRWPEHPGLVIARDSWGANQVRAAAHDAVIRLARAGAPVDRDEWFAPAHIVDAWYDPYRNEMTFPAGILQPPFFDGDGDEAQNLGSMGAVIGHEITHGFDDEGSRYDADGRRADWWTDEDRAAFDRLGDRLAAQFDAYEVLPGVHINGRLTLGENIADLGGLAIALDTLRAAIADGTADGATIGGRTPEQRLFLAYASAWRFHATEGYLRVKVASDPHAPPRFRVNGPVSNLEAFARAFDVPDGAPLARPPEDRVRIW